jgi:hypothetical protein
LLCPGSPEDGSFRAWDRKIQRAITQLMSAWSTRPMDEGITGKGEVRLAPFSKTLTKETEPQTVTCASTSKMSPALVRGCPKLLDSFFCYDTQDRDITKQKKTMNIHPFGLNQP